MDDIFNTYPDVVNVKQVAEMLHVGTVLAYKLVKSGAIKSRKVGRDYKISKTAVAAFLLELEDKK